jgi:hypothetical protein
LWKTEAYLGHPIASASACSQQDRSEYRHHWQLFHRNSPVADATLALSVIDIMATSDGG